MLRYFRLAEIGAFAITLAVLPGQMKGAALTDKVVDLGPGAERVLPLPGGEKVPEGSALAVTTEIRLDKGRPVSVGLAVAMKDSMPPFSEALPDGKKVILEITDQGETGFFTASVDGKTVSFWDRVPGKKNMFPHYFTPSGDTVRLGIVLIPRGDETGVRFFRQDLNRPIRMYDYDTESFELEWRIPRKLADARQAALVLKNAQTQGESSRFEVISLKAESVPTGALDQWMGSSDFVMANLNDNALDGIYSKASWFREFSEPDELARENGMPRWDRDPGFLNRHYHWVVLAHAWKESGDNRYLERIADELIDYVAEEPTVWYKNPNLGGTLDVVDGTVWGEHMLVTGNIGRRLELTWWQVFEVVRQSPDFSDEAIFAFLDSVIRQCRTLMNPTVFQEWDDSGLHGAMAPVKSSILFPMAAEAPQWAEVGWKRINRIVDIQFHPDGSHVSLSRGYSWATIGGFDGFAAFLKRNNEPIPENIQHLLETMYFHQLALTRPNFQSIDLNDGMWSAIGREKIANAVERFPEREDYRFFLSNGIEGVAPDPPSAYFPNAGQYVMRTGWGNNQKYLFFGAGPWGASHGKMDALNIYAAWGPHLLIRNAGRGAYSGVGNTIHAGRSLSFNVLSPDWGQENSVPHWEKDRHIGFHPPERRWINSEHFEYGEGVFTYGWHTKDKHIPGRWMRQVVFVKGAEPVETGYYLIVDSVHPESSEPITWRHPWHFGLPQISVDPGILSATATSPAAAVGVRGIAAFPMKVSIVEGQTEPELLGRRIHGEEAVRWPVPTFEWNGQGVFAVVSRDVSGAISEVFDVTDGEKSIAWTRSPDSPPALPKAKK